MVNTKTHYLVIFGAPGSGKGTQSKLIAEKLNLSHISTGEILRSAISSGSDLGKKVAETMAAGNLVGDDIMCSLIENVIQDFAANPDKGFIFDGYPRTYEQVQFFEKTLAASGLAVTRAIELTVPIDQILARIESRSEASGNTRSDDSVEVASKRYEIFKAECLPVIEFYKNKGLLKSFNGVGTIEQINRQILSCL